MSSPKNVAVVIFDEVEVLDFCGPFEVFSVAGRRHDLDPFNVYTVAETNRPILARNHLSVNPRYTIADCPTPDILVVPGGYGTRREMANAVLVQWIKQAAAGAQLTLSVCTGALLLARAGVLDGLTATTHHGAFDVLRENAPNTNVVEERYVDNGSVITSAGVAAGIDMSLHIVERELGREVAEEAAHYIEYRWQQPNH